MRKILMRAALNPLKNPSVHEVVLKNLVGGNAGNMVFAYSVIRTLLREDTVIDTTTTLTPFSDEEVERINAEYDCFVLPLANAFRSTFKKELAVLISLVKRLRIPCVVVGVGVQANVDESINTEFDFDELAKEFVKEVLEKSEIIGVRGEITAEYLKKLGFTEERDFTVIGCPSMYIHGDEIPLKTPVDLNENSLVSVNRKINIPAALHEFLVKESNKFKNYMYVPQGIDDLLLLYAGVPIDRNKYPNIYEKNYPWELNSEICASGHEIGFTSVPSWMKFLGSRDFSFGTRIHGNITAVVSGIPAFIFVPDSRILELARYHNIQYMLAKEITDETDIFKIYERADFYRVQRGHKERFYHYLDFLEKNNLPHIFMEDRSNKHARLDDIVSNFDVSDGITAFNRVSIDEQTERMAHYSQHMRETIAELKSTRNLLNKRNIKVEAENQRLNEYIESLGLLRKVDSCTKAVKNPNLVKLYIQKKLGKDVAEKVKIEKRKSKLL